MIRHDATEVQPSSRPAGAGILRLYPAGWRRRYEAEMLAVLGDLRIGPRGRLDLIRGAIDARLHGSARGVAVAALIAGGLWTVAGVGGTVQPAPPDWPGYLHETIPLLIVATVLGATVLVGSWARRSDESGRLGSIAVLVAIVGSSVWTIALIAAWLGFGYGAVTGLAQAAGAIGASLVGLVLLRAGDPVVGATLVVAPALMLFGLPLAWVGFGLGWTVIGVVLLRPESDPGLPTRFA